MLYRLNHSCSCYFDKWHPTSPRFLLSGFDRSRPIDLSQPIGEDFPDYGFYPSNNRAPEELRASDKQDIWAFGCIVMEVASSGQHVAFNSYHDVIQYSKGASPMPQVQKKDNPKLDVVSRNHLNSILQYCFQIDPSNRPSAEGLRGVLTGQHVGHVPSS